MVIIPFSEMKTSVVIPVYNEEHYIKDCLLSLMNQEEKPDEIIIVDNNSKDNTVKIAKEFPVTVVSEKTQGTAYARNTGFNLAKGPLIIRTDADCRVPPTWIKQIKLHFEKNPKLVGLSGRSYFYGFPPIIKTPYWPTETYLKASKRFLKHAFMYGPNMALSKNAWEKIKDKTCTQDSQMHEDVDLGIHLSDVGSIVFDPKLWVSTSPRRAKKVMSYFHYPYKYFKMLQDHKKLVLGMKIPKISPRKVISYLSSKKW